MRPRKILPSLLALLCLLTADAAAQQPPGRDMNKEQEIWRQLQNISPASLETFKQATAALDANNYAEAARLYEEVIKKAPDFSPVLRRLGSVWVESGKTAEGMALLERAVENERTPENLSSLAQAMAYPGSGGAESSRQQKQAAYVLAAEADAKAESGDSSYPALVAQLALELEREEAFRAAVAKLKRKFPGDVATHYYSAVEAAIDHDWVTAEDEIRAAERLGLHPEAAREFLANTGAESKARVWRYAFYVLYLAVAWAVGLLLLFVLGKIFSGLTMRSVESADPDELSGGRHEKLKKAYRALINVAGLYYYISLPVVLCLVVLAAAAVFYGFYTLGRIPIKLVAILAIGALITVYQMVRSLFVRREQEDPGRALEEREAPGLWALAREVAASVGTRPVDEIRVTPGTDLAVYERGSYRERRQDKARRVLILGVGVLDGFSLNAFRAVLAHEYGHFSNRDTAGGDVAIRVNNDMVNFAYAMALGGQAVWYNIAFLFLRVYHFIFRRISHGATRLQEMLADRVAVYNYGAHAFKEGLSHVVYRGVEFGHLVGQEIEEASRGRRSLQNIYELPRAKGGAHERTVEAAFNEALHRKTSEDDTHPSPVERFRLASRVKTKGEPEAGGDVWELFADREGLTREMSRLVEANVAEAQSAEVAYA
ncbi:MAG TPA: tetratricopeptide repeat protein [Pyrinomonadaceae bacterium]|nr:tetratricopeptide repeat protein [Pyrinomonadaceae bacterium]